jgi:hypothetical protein
LALATFFLGLETWKLTHAWRKTSADQINAWFKTSADQISVQTWLALEPRFDSKDMRRFRKKLAEQMDPYDPAKHDEITEEVFELFESIGIVYKRGLLNKDLADSSFSFHATRWWEAAKHYVDEERKRNGDDLSLFRDFEDFAKAMREHDPLPSHRNLKKAVGNLQKTCHTAGE